MGKTILLTFGTISRFVFEFGVIILAWMLWGWHVGIALILWYLLWSWMGVYLIKMWQSEDAIKTQTENADSFFTLSKDVEQLFKKAEEEAKKEEAQKEKKDNDKTI